MSIRWSVIFKSFGMALLSLPVWLLAFIVVPVALAFRKQEDDHLPHLLRWWDEPTYGINGDPYWSGPEHANGHEREYLWRLRWLFRNSLGGWSHDVMGFDTSRIRVLEWEGDPDTQNIPAGHSGTCYIKVTLDDGSTRECFYIVKQWGSSNRCFRGYFGYKLMDVLHRYLAAEPFGGNQIQDVFSPNPLMGFKRCGNG
ncbi:MAG: hypothetical protein K8H84_07365 [Sulfuricella denitrificans]|nr:hypothetical protein [Sulfuricella denitrificans]